MAVALLQPSFTSGEISPALYGRVDIARYQTGLRRCRNFIVRPHGGVSNRPGTRFVSTTRDQSAASVLIPFIFSTTQAYILEFSAGFIQVFANGGFVQNVGTSTITNVTVTGIGPYTRTITTAAAHGLVVGQQVTISGVVATGVYLVNGIWNVLSTPSATTFTIKTSSSTSGSYTSGGVVSSSLTITNPYATEDLASLRFAQSADVLTVVHPDFPPQEFRRLSASSFTFAPAVYDTGPFLDLNVNEVLFVHASARKGTVTLTATQNIFTATHVGALFYLEQRDLSEVPPWEPNKKLVANPASTLNLRRRSDGKTYKCVTDYTPAAEREAWTGTVRPLHEKGVAADGDGSALNTTLVDRAGVDWEYQDSGFGIARITAVASGVSATATVLRTLPANVVGGATTGAGPYNYVGDGVTVTFAAAGATDPKRTMWEVTLAGVIQAPETYEVDVTANTVTFYTAPANTVAIAIRQLSVNNRSDKWALGAWGEHQGYPSVVTYFQDRLVYAASRERPQTMWGSKNANYVDYGVSVPSVDDDAVDFTMNARQINAIRDLIPLDKLIALTSAGAWKVTDGQNEVLTPSTVGFKPQSYRGAKALRSVIIGDGAVFVQDGGRKLRTLEYALENDKFSGVNLSILANHLLTKNRTIVDMDYAEEPHAILWQVRSDGKLLALTYDKEQNVIGWTHSDTRGGFFERVCSIPEEGDNAVYVVVRRVINGATVRYIERFAEREIEDVRDAFFVDAGLTFDGLNTTATTMTLTGSAWTVNDDLTLTNNGGLFAATDVGDEVWLHIDTQSQDEEGEPITLTETVRLRIIAYTTTLAVTVRASKNVPASFQNVAFTNWTFARDTFAGLGHLEGETVEILADGNHAGNAVVTGGQISIDTPGGLVHVGLGIVADLELLDLNVIGQESVRHRAKSIPRVALLVQESRSIKAGPDLAHLEEYTERSEEEDYDAPITPISDVVQLYVPCTWSENGRIRVRQDKPLPLTVIGVIPQVEFGGEG